MKQGNMSSIAYSLRETFRHRRRLMRVFKRKGLGGMAPLFRMHRAKGMRPEIVEPNVYSLQLEPTKRCNQACPMCSQPKLDKSERGDMSFEQFHHVMSQFPNVVELKLQGLGEIFLNKDIWKMLEFCKDNSIKTHFATNGVLLKPEVSRRLVDLGLMEVRFSIDTLDRDLYKRTRGVDTFEKVRSNIAKFTEIREKHGKKSLDGHLHPSAEIRMVCFDENMDELPQMVHFASEIGLEKVTATFILTKRHSHEQSSFAKDNSVEMHGSERVEILISNARSVAKEAGVKLSFIPYSKGAFGNCEWPWRMPYITYDGYVTPCCHLENPKVPGNLGNVLETPFEEIWNSEGYRTLRSHHSDLSVNKLCRMCPYLSEEELAEVERLEAAERN